MHKNSNTRILVLFSLLVLTLLVVLALDGCGSSPQKPVNQPQSNSSQASQDTAPAQETSGTTVATPAPAPTSSQTPQVTAPKSTSTASTATAPAAQPAPTTTAPTPAPAPAPAASPVSSGQTLYAAQCQSCHGSNAAGGSAPSLKGTPSKYGSQSALSSYIQANMPLTSPHSLSSTDANNLAAYLFSLK